MQELIERLEKATGADSELNADVWLATRVKWSDRAYLHWKHKLPRGAELTTERYYALERAPSFMGSLDVAMSLFADEGRSVVELQSAVRQAIAHGDYTKFGVIKRLVIASLKALNQMKGK